MGGTKVHTKVLQSSFQTGSTRSPSYFQIFILIAYFEEAFNDNALVNLLKPSGFFTYHQAQH
jgi:hypothetical protein